MDVIMDPSNGHDHHQHEQGNLPYVDEHEHARAMRIPFTDNSIRNAVQVDNITLTLSKATILKNCSLQVPYGTIYSLLGSSGCGKTSLIKCILGLLQPCSGSIHVLGKLPNSSEEGVPGHNVGYMPQELSLYKNLTILETLKYFGLLFRMTPTNVLQRITFLTELLHINDIDKKQLVETMSGGQRRRLSLACALIHKPPLLLLDEPTVGVDPLLRRQIWEHLTWLSHNEKRTVLITTHYIEEAKNSHFVGMLRNNRIIIQEKPQVLLHRYEMESLEEVFLELCRNDHHEQLRRAEEREELRECEPSGSSGISTRSSSPEESLELVTHQSPPEPRSSSPMSCVILPPTYAHQTGQMVTLWALLCRSWTSLGRDPFYVCFQLLLPMLEIIIFCDCIGKDLHGIDVALYDGDNTSFSRSILDQFDPYYFNFTRYNSVGSAIQSVKEGLQHAVVEIPANFSLYLNDRLLDPTLIDEAFVKKSSIQVYGDYTSKFFVLFSVSNLISSKLFRQDHGSQCFSQNHGLVHQRWHSIFGFPKRIALHAQLSRQHVQGNLWSRGGYLHRVHVARCHVECPLPRCHLTVRHEHCPRT